MTEKNKTLMTIEKVKAFAMAVVAAGIFSMGSTYFSEQASYRVPRILTPVFEILGNVGLAIGMLILGGILMYFAHKKFTENEGKPMIILVIQVIAILGFYGVIFSESSKTSTIEDIKASIERDRNKTQAIIANSERPDIDNALVNTYLDKLEDLKTKFEKSVNEKNKIQFEECVAEYDTLTTTDFAPVVKTLTGKPEYPDFAMYNAKVLEEIDVFRTHKW